MTQPSAPKPEVHRLAGDEFVFTWPSLALRATVEILGDDKAGVAADVTLQTASGGHLHSGRLNLMATRSRTELATALGKRGGNGVIPWGDVVEQLSTLAVREWRRLPPVTDLAAAVPEDRPVYLDSAGLLACGELNLFYGPGESAKSLFLLAQAVSLQHLKDLAGIHPLRQVVPAYLDWEDTPWVRATTLRAVYRGLEIDQPKPFPHLRLERPLHDCQKLVREFVRDQHITLPLIDSFVPAAGGEPESSDAMARLYRAVRGFGEDVTTVVISHVSKADLDRPQTARAFGSVMVGNLSRSVWQVIRGDQDAEAFTAASAGTPARWEFRVGLLQTKKSIGRKGRLGAAIVLTGPNFTTRPADVITFSPAEFTADPGLRSRLSTKAQILAELRTSPQTTQEIASALNIPVTTARWHLNGLLRLGQVTRVKVGGGGRGYETTWKVASHD